MDNSTNLNSLLSNKNALDIQLINIYRPHQLKICKSLNSTPLCFSDCPSDERCMHSVDETICPFKHENLCRCTLGMSFKSGENAR